MSEITHDRRLEILESLGSTICGSCGRPKRRKMSHCYVCYMRLTREMRRALYRGFGDGYEEAYEALLAYLKGDGQ